MTFPPARPEIPVGQLEPALAYYRDCLGFAIDWSDEELGLAGVSQGDSGLFIAATHYRLHLRSAAGPAVIWLNLSSCAEVDQLYERWLTASAKLEGPPWANKPYRLYEFLAYDPDGNIVRVFYFMSEQEVEQFDGERGEAG